MEASELALTTGEAAVELDWVPERISRFVGQLATVWGEASTELIPPLSIVRDDDRTLFACSGVQIIYPQIFDGEAVPDSPRLISQPVIRTQHLPNVREGTSTSFVNYNLIAFGVSEAEHIAATEVFFEHMLGVDEASSTDSERVHVTDWPQNWNGLDVLMNTNEKLWINGVELGESIFYGDMQLPNGETVAVSELAFGLERLFLATEPDEGQQSYFSAMLGGVDSGEQGLEAKDLPAARVCDALKSCTLMAMHGVMPSNKAQGYRLRKFVKRAVTENEIAQLDVDELIANSFHYWSSFLPSQYDFDEVKAVLRTEYERNQNRLTLDKLKDEYRLQLGLNINQSRAAFMDQLKISDVLPVGAYESLVELPITRAKQY